MEPQAEQHRKQDLGPGQDDFHCQTAEAAHRPPAIEEEPSILRSLGLALSKCCTTQHVSQPLATTSQLLFPSVKLMSVELPVLPQVLLSVQNLMQPGPCGLFFLHEGNTLAGACSRARAPVSSGSEFTRGSKLRLDVELVARQWRSDRHVCLPVPMLDSSQSFTAAVSEELRTLGDKADPDTRADVILSRFQDLCAQSPCIGVLTVATCHGSSATARELANLAMVVCEFAPYLVSDWRTFLEIAGDSMVQHSLRICSGDAAHAARHPHQPHHRPQHPAGVLGDIREDNANPALGEGLSTDSGVSYSAGSHTDDDDMDDMDDEMDGDVDETYDSMYGDYYDESVMTDAGFDGRRPYCNGMLADDGDSGAAALPLQRPTSPCHALGLTSAVVAAAAAAGMGDTRETRAVTGDTGRQPWVAGQQHVEEVGETDGNGSLGCGPQAAGALGGGSQRRRDDADDDDCGDGSGFGGDGSSSDGPSSTQQGSMSSGTSSGGGQSSSCNQGGSGSRSGASGSKQRAIKGPPSLAPNATAAATATGGAPPAATVTDTAEETTGGRDLESSPSSSSPLEGSGKTACPSPAAEGGPSGKDAQARQAVIAAEAAAAVPRMHAGLLPQYEDWAVERRFREFYSRHYCLDDMLLALIQLLPMLMTMMGLGAEAPPAPILPLIIALLNAAMFVVLPLAMRSWYARHRDALCMGRALLHIVLSQGYAAALLAPTITTSAQLPGGDSATAGGLAAVASAAKPAGLGLLFISSGAINLLFFGLQHMRPSALLAVTAVQATVTAASAPSLCASHCAGLPASACAARMAAVFVGFGAIPAALASYVGDRCMRGMFAQLAQRRAAVAAAAAASAAAAAGGEE